MPLSLGLTPEELKKRHCEQKRAWRINNHVYIREYRRNYERRKKKEDELFNAKNKITKLIGASFKLGGFKKNTKSVAILGCTYSEFKSYIESKFESWMCWANHGQTAKTYNVTWQLDHIKPLSTAKTIEDIIKLNHYTNFQPLCSKKNREKWGKQF